MSGSSVIPASSGGSRRIKTGVLGTFIVPPLSAGGLGVATASASSTAYGAWAQLSGSSGTDAAGLLTNVVVWPNVTSPFQLLFQIGIGSAGTEIPVFGSALIPGASSTSASVSVAYTLPIPVYVPAGSRVALRAACGSAAISVYASCTFVPTAALESY